MYSVVLLCDVCELCDSLHFWASIQDVQRELTQTHVGRTLHKVMIYTGNKFNRFRKYSKNT